MARHDGHSVQMHGKQGHVGHGATVGVTGAVRDPATPEGATQTTTAFVK